MSAEEGNNGEHYEDVGRLKSEVHTLTKAVEKLFNKFDEFVQNNTPKQLSIPIILGSIATLLTIFGAVFAGAIFLVNALNAPIVANQNQQAAMMQTLSAIVSKAVTEGQLTNKEVSVVSKQTAANEETIRWMLYEERLPQQITKLNGRLDNLQLQLNLKGSP